MTRIISAWLFAAMLLTARTYEIGADKEFKTIKEVATKTLLPGDQVLIYPGTYKEAVFWRGGSLLGEPIVVRGVGATRPIIDGAGVSVIGASGIPRALFQVEGLNYVFENLELRNARNGQNGAGVRVLGTTSGAPSNVVFRHLLVRWNDMGFMSSQNNDILVEHSEIAWNGTPEYNGYAHNFYLDGNRVVVRYCYLHDSTSGEVFKARSHYVELQYNYIADAHDRIDYGDTTKEVGFAEGPFTTSANSHAVLIGNIFVKRGTGYAFFDFGPEGTNSYRNGTLFMINNTIIREADVPHWFLRLGSTMGKAVLVNNVFYAKATTAFARGPGNVNITDSNHITGSNNWFPQGTVVPSGLTGSIFGTDPGFVDLASRDYTLKANSVAVNAGTGDLKYLNDAGVETPVQLQSYVAHMQFGPRPSDGSIDLGAYELATVSKEITGKITKTNGEPLARQVVLLQGTDPRSTITDAQGIYRFLNVRDQSATVKPWDADVQFVAGPSQGDFVSAPAYTVSGTLLSRTKGEPIAGAILYLNGRDSRWTLTDSLGKFRFPLIPGGSANTLVIKHPAVTAPADISHVLDPLTADLSLDLRVDFKYSITVSARDPQNRGIIAIGLELTGTGISTPVLASTNTRGNWSFNGLPDGGSYTVRITSTPAIFPQSTWQITNLQKNETITAIGPLIVNLTGVVKNQGGQPVPGAIVRSTGTQTYNATADSIGRYLFNFFLLGGTYNLTATSPLATFPPVAAEIASLSTTQGDVDVVGTAIYTITARVTTESGGVLSGIPVRMTGDVVKAFNTDSLGQVKFTNIPEGSRVLITPDRPLFYTFTPAFSEITVTGPQTITFVATPR